jgi:hypothetical protein
MLPLERHSVKPSDNFLRRRPFPDNENKTRCAQYNAFLANMISGGLYEINPK